ncbi:MAG: hypothetical protein K2V38_13175 [Gemmataceae bacterium]|nr:hypothetical protein [Gemmataceae bacterium]
MAKRRDDSPSLFEAFDPPPAPPPPEPPSDPAGPPRVECPECYTHQAAGYRCCGVCGHSLLGAVKPGPIPAPVKKKRPEEVEF